MQARSIIVVALGAAVALMASAETAHAQESQAPDGFWLGGGLNAGSRGYGGAGLRLEAGIPLKEVGPGLLALNLPLSTLHHANRGWCFDGRCDRSRRWNALYLVPEVQYEWPIPIDIPQRFSVVGMIGAGLALFWDYGDWDGTYDNRHAAFGIVPLRTGAAARFGFVNGWFVQVQPVGFALNVAFGDRYRDDRYDYYDNFFVTYEFWAMGGYRWD
ncbi:MAG: hypothetical protein ACOCV4_04175 [Myxococcota bacterium]